MLNRFLEKDDSHEFKPVLAEIEDSPDNPLGKAIFWIVIFIIILSIIWMILGKIDIVVTARGQVIPEGEAKIIQPLDAGVIDKILVKEGDFVRKGQVLVEINPSPVKPELESLKNNLEYLTLEAQRLKAQAEGISFNPKLNSINKNQYITQLDIYNSSLNAHQKQLIAKKIEIQRIDEQIKSVLITISHNNNLLLTNKDKEKRLKEVLDIIPKSDYEKVCADISENESNIKEDRKSVV